MKLGERLDFATADQRLEGELDRTFRGFYSADRRVLLFDGGVALAGELLEALGETDPPSTDLIAVRGDLTVHGRILLPERFPGLYVSGFTRADTLEGGDSRIYIGDGAFRYFVSGYYNDGVLSAGTVQTPWVINEDHDLRLAAADAYWIDNHADSDDADFTPSNIAASFVPEVVERDQVDRDALLEHLRAGKQVLLPGATGWRR